MEGGKCGGYGVALCGVRRSLQQPLVGFDGEVEHFVVAFRTGDRSCVISDGGHREAVLRKALADLLPSAHAVARIRLGQCPQVPRAAIRRVGRDSASRQFTDDLRAASLEPVRVGKDDECTRIVRLRLDD